MEGAWCEGGWCRSPFLFAGAKCRWYAHPWCVALLLCLLITAFLYRGPVRCGWMLCNLWRGTVTQGKRESVGQIFWFGFGLGETGELTASFFRIWKDKYNPENQKKK